MLVGSSLLQVSFFFYSVSVFLFYLGSYDPHRHITHGNRSLVSSLFFHHPHISPNCFYASLSRHFFFPQISKYHLLVYVYFTDSSVCHLFFCQSSQFPLPQMMEKTLWCYVVTNLCHSHPILCIFFASHHLTQFAIPLPSSSLTTARTSINTHTYQPS